jgi:hypothetical protein
MMRSDDEEGALSPPERRRIADERAQLDVTADRLNAESDELLALVSDARRGWTEIVRIRGWAGCFYSLVYTIVVFLLGLWIGSISLDAHAARSGAQAAQ